ncbi:hypothetical protein [Geothrix sp. PMB-07]|uniref:hypothetical protein n=1 Tax=Geothrix sp. PMB-07 TaxID=3068640 RepID=UPI002740B472|nr:hypothetical protein [Geothrix sp. PMB-07]WLT31116.1 hypothetical protein Q9293_15465 [Geothrix sp. PMB-07]
MNPDRLVKILFVDEDESVWIRAGAFFRHQLNLVGGEAQLHFRAQLPGRAAGFDMVSLEGRNLIPMLLDRPGLQADLRQTAILNLHADAPGPTFSQLRRLLGRCNHGLRGDGLWVFPQSWMAPWFQEALEFPELDLRLTAPPPRPVPLAVPARPWERHSAQIIQGLAHLRLALAP